MLAKRIIACLDIDGGRVVKGKRFVEMRDAGEPAMLAARYCSQGADEIIVLDVSATNERRLASGATIERVARAIDVPLCVGGGIRTLDDVARLLDAGADKVSINSAAVADPRMLTRVANRYGSQCVVLAIDARRSEKGYEIATHGARVFERRMPQAWAVRGQKCGAGEILLTSIDRDGEGRGFDLELTSSVSQAVSIPVVASGGASDALSFVDAFFAGADAALGASLFHFDGISVGAVKAVCSEAGVRVRL